MANIEVHNLTTEQLQKLISKMNIRHVHLHDIPGWGYTDDPKVNYAIDCLVSEGDEPVIILHKMRSHA